MGKVFTITEGLENMGALRTGGQGSIYKGKRIGEIIIAVKLLPTPILSEDKNDKNFRDFQNEVEKLKKVNEVANPNVVKILNSGITESGSFPFIEMEFIEGPDLEELLKAPHEPVFTIKEIIKVADQLANALSHCHKISIKHGDIKGNNVKFNVNTGNYILLDFGLAVMSDEQRRTSLRHAGAVEFMAPEQNEGQMLFQSDVYSYGILLYELLAGTVPFPLTNNGQTARNTVMVSHMEMPVPDALELRKGHLPESWSEEKKEREMQVPQWLLSIISKCLEKNPDDRFKDGTELHEAIAQNSTSALKNNIEGSSDLQSENDRLYSVILKEHKLTTEKEQQIVLLKGQLALKDKEINALKSNKPDSAAEEKKSVKISKPVFFTLLLLLTCLGVFAAFSMFSKKENNSGNITASKDTASVSETDTTLIKTPTDHKKEKRVPKDSLQTEKDLNAQQAAADPGTDANPGSDNTSEPATNNDPGPDDTGKVFTLAVSQTYFHNQPDESTRRNAFINSYNNARLTALNDLNGFIYVIYKNDEGQITKGWLNKKDLIIIGQ